MRILGHIHSLNDEEVIDRSVQSLLGQTYPVEEILLVDNGSTDGTLNRSFPKQVTVLRHPENRGTSGAVVTGFQYALAKEYDWIWLFDADSAPRKDALEKLIELYQSFTPELQAQTWLLASLPVEVPTQKPRHGLILTPRGSRQVQPHPGQLFYECDVAIWTGSLYNLARARRVGLPSADYVLDGGECEYGYRGKRCGYKAFMHQSSILDHNIGGQPAVLFSRHRFGPLSFNLVEVPPIRYYYLFRNSLYFWLYEYRERNIYAFLHECSWLPKHVLKILLLPGPRWPKLSPCLRGAWDGLRKNMHHRF